MGNFKQDRGKRSSGFGERSEGRSNHSKGRGEGFSRDRGPVTMHQTVCDECGKSCEVPFRPTEGKPVYCNDCFSRKKPENERGNERFSKDKFNNHKTSPRGDFESSGNKGNNDELREQLVILNSKMDRLIKAVENTKNEKSQMFDKKIVKDIPVLKTKEAEKKTSSSNLKEIKKKMTKSVPKKKSKKTSVVKVVKAKKRNVKKTKK
ncbi:MAG: hypothetical protein KAI71_00180 [Candidatus Pacebacteria bacterium]|nr:hypothetical protein [Candidatus Paceibacterota bacterium]